MGAGLASTASSPSLRAASRAASPAWAVRTTAGSPGSTRRISRTRAAPPMPGMRMSVTIASKRVRATFRIPSAPLAAISQSQPQSPAISTRFSANSRLSSTKR